MSIDVETLLLLRAKQEAEAANSPLGPPLVLLVVLPWAWPLALACAASTS